MAKIVVVEPKAERAEIVEALTNAGHVVLEADSAATALEWVKASPADLVILNAATAAPGAIALRSSIRKVLASYPVSFIFVAGPGEAGDALAAALTEPDDLFLMRRPLSATRLLRTVDALVGEVTRAEGKFGDSSFDHILLQIEARSESGVLTAYRESIVKKVVFHAGSVAFAGSNDPRERIGQTFVALGLITEQELKDAMALQATDPRPLAKLLQGIARISQEEADATVRRKFGESVLELYLWDEGTWTFAASKDAPPANAMEIEIGPIRAEGAKRGPRWRRLKKMLPSDDMRFALIPESFPKGFPSDAGDRRLIELIRAGVTLGQIRLELRGQEFAVYTRLADLMLSNALTTASEHEEIRDPGGFEDIPEPEAQPVAPPPPPSSILTDTDDETTRKTRAAEARAEFERKPGERSAEEIAVKTLLLEAEEASEKGDAATARKLYGDILVIEPSNAFARRGVAGLERDLTAKLGAGGVTASTTVMLAISDAEVSKLPLKPEAAFVLMRVAHEPTRVEDIQVVTPLPEVKVLEILDEFVKSGAIKIVL